MAMFNEIILLRFIEDIQDKLLRMLYSHHYDQLYKRIIHLHLHMHAES